MTTRRPIVGGNWKTNTRADSAVALAEAVAADSAEGCDVVVFPPLVYAAAVSGTLEGTRIAVGVQNAYHAGDGAYTGEVSVAMAIDVGASFVLVGHSERRHVIGETDELINAKMRAVLEAPELTAVLCVGETLEQREAGQTDAVNTAQVRSGLAGLTPEQMTRVVIAYEPVWAIGTGKTATPADAQSAHRHIRSVLAMLFNDDIAGATRIQYGGSMKPDNARELMDQPDIDGGLVGGASLDADAFLQIVRHAAASRA